MSKQRSAHALTRRQTLALLGAAGAVSFARLGRNALAGAACLETAPATQGPFWIDAGLERTDITTDPSDGTARPGVPLTLRLNVSRSDGGCAPAAGVQVDVWQCDAAGLYSDEAGTGTAGGQFLRGYQVTDANGAVQFTTIYPGWYPGRTIHVHYRVRTFAGGVATFDFASQLYFDDAINNQVLAKAPYDARGARDRTNADDALFDQTQLLTLGADGSDGYVGSFDVGVRGLAAPAGTGGACSDLATCRAAVTAALPDPSTATTRKRRKTAHRLARLHARASAALDRAGPASGKRRARQYQKARGALAKVVTVATAADAGGTLGVPLDPLALAITALLAVVPSA